MGVRLLFEVLVCPKSPLELKTLASKWREGSRVSPCVERPVCTGAVKGLDLGLKGGSPTTASEEEWHHQLLAFSRPCFPYC